MAKDATDNRIFITIFVTSKGITPIQMLEHSVISCLSNMLEVKDLSYSEVTNLLCNKHNMSVSQMKAIYALIGRWIKLIKKVTRELEKGTNWTRVEKLILAQAYKDFDKASMISGGKFRDVGRKISKHILKCGYISHDDLRHIIPSIDSREMFLSLNVFASMPELDSITFHSKPTEIVAQKIF
ncbi:hypothetical protein B9Z19DRAFT_1064415 [Tuber borchii]|uniref:Uncharacterized protein n=1 Tax=Tuber borchii TaxID=42251 RepID=A0A2T6ZUS7_TUBBO|nr:hypothetical protein B9Z19DRAFT_1064415 [Tuber borchii]